VQNKRKKGAPLLVLPFCFVCVFLVGGDACSSKEGRRKEKKTWKRAAMAKT
jgi:hypothetical protein